MKFLLLILYVNGGAHSLVTESEQACNVAGLNAMMHKRSVSTYQCYRWEAKR